MVYMGPICSALMIGYLSNHFGRKTTLVSVGILGTVGWTLIGFSGMRLEIVYLGRFLTGFAILTPVWQVTFFLEQCKK